MVTVVVAVLVVVATSVLLVSALCGEGMARRPAVARPVEVVEREIEAAIELHSIRRRLEVAEVTAQIRADGVRARREVEEYGGWPI